MRDKTGGELHDELRRLLGTRVGNAVRWAGIGSVNELVEFIQKTGLKRWQTRNGAVYSFGGYGGAPLTLRQCGPAGWERITRALESVGFDWRQFVVPPKADGKNREELDAAILSKIDELSDLLHWYRNTVRIGVEQPTAQAAEPGARATSEFDDDKQQ